MDPSLRVLLTIVALVRKEIRGIIVDQNVRNSMIFEVPASLSSAHLMECLDDYIHILTPRDGTVVSVSHSIFAGDVSAASLVPIYSKRNRS